MKCKLWTLCIELEIGVTHIKIGLNLKQQTFTKKQNTIIFLFD
jgi:hypothetical protein